MYDSLYKRVLKRVCVKDFPMKITLQIHRNRLCIRLYGVKCRKTGEELAYLEFNRRLVKLDTEEQILKYIYWNIQEAVLHEIAETFKFESRIAYDPHMPETGSLIIGPPDKNWLTMGVPD